MLPGYTQGEDGVVTVDEKLLPSEPLPNDRVPLTRGQILSNRDNQFLGGFRYEMPYFQIPAHIQRMKAFRKNPNFWFHTDWFGDCPERMRLRLIAAQEIGCDPVSVFNHSDKEKYVRIGTPDAAPRSLWDVHVTQSNRYKASYTLDAKLYRMNGTPLIFRNQEHLNMYLLADPKANDFASICGKDDNPSQKAAHLVNWPDWADGILELCRKRYAEKTGRMGKKYISQFALMYFKDHPIWATRRTPFECLLMAGDGYQHGYTGTYEWLIESSRNHHPDVRMAEVD